MTDSLAAALAAFQAELPKVEKTAAAIITGEKDGRKFTYGYKYADLAAITAIVLPLLGKHGLSFTSKPTLGPNGFVLAYSLRHAAGETNDGEYPLPDPVRTKPQTIGSFITYARRYALCAATGLAPADEDDDAQAAQADDRAEYIPETRADGSATEAEQARMNRGPVPGTQRLKETPPDDPFYDVAKSNQVPKEDLPGTVSTDQLRRMHAEFKKLGYDQNDRNGRLSLTKEIIGREVHSANSLSFTEAQRLNNELADLVKDKA
jgi:hypothetical protein